MGFLDDVKRLLRREAADAKEWLDDSVAGGNAHLDRAERRLSADPEERLQATLDDIAANDDAFAALQAKADAATARPAAQAEVVDVSRTGETPSGDASAAEERTTSDDDDTADTDVDDRPVEDPPAGGALGHA